jgi:hypothetical protein
MRSKNLGSIPKPTSERFVLPGKTKSRIVYVGPKGGKYMKHKNQYVPLCKVMTGGAKEDDNTSDEDLNSDDDDHETHQRLYREWLARKQQQSDIPTQPPMTVIHNMLRGMTTPYAIIGGQAAIYHITQSSRNLSENVKAQISTNDIDVAIPMSSFSQVKDKVEIFLKKKLPKLPLNSKTVDGRSYIQIHMIGVRDPELQNINSIIDLHGIPDATFNRIPRIQDSNSNLWYASVKWLCEELQTHVGSTNAELKNLKHQRRKQELNCNGLATPKTLSSQLYV